MNPRELSIIKDLVHDWREFKPLAEEKPSREERRERVSECFGRRCGWYEKVSK